MVFAEFLNYLSFVTHIVVNMSVAFWMFPLWHQRRLPFLAILGCSGIVGAFCSVVNWFLENRLLTQEAYFWLWHALMIFGIFDSLLYALGIGLMARYFRSALLASNESPRLD